MSATRRLAMIRFARMRSSCLLWRRVRYLLFPPVSPWFQVGPGVANQDRRNGEQLSMEEPDGAVIAGSMETPGAFGIIFDRHGSTLLRFLARRATPAVAGDLLGEVSRSAFERRSTLERDGERPRPRLYGI